MMHYIYQLRFTTSVHFGLADLDKAEPFLTADTLFNAICCELAAYGEQQLLADFIADCKAGKLSFSDLLPYQESDGEVFYYLPKPLLPASTVGEAVMKQNFKAMKQLLNRRQAMKSVRFLRASHISPYLQSIQESSSYTEQFDFIDSMERTFVNCRLEEPAPYLVKTHNFQDRAGLYFLVTATEDKDISSLTQLIESIGLGGIGGRRSSGYGKFELVDDPYDLRDDGYYVDDGVLSKMLDDTAATWQMNLAALWPCLNEVELLKRGYYTLRHVGGFTIPDGKESAVRKNSVYMVDAGSCMRNRLQGCVKEIGMADNHSILRYGKGMFVGVRV